MSSVPPLYKNIGKNFKELVEKKYDFTRELKVKTTTGAGVTFESSGRTNSKTSDYTGALKTTYKRAQVGTFDVEVDTEGHAKFNAELDALKKGLVVKLSGDQSPSETVDVSYRKDNLALTAAVTAAPKGITAEVSGVVGHQGLFVGGTTKLNGNTQQLTDYNISAQYSKGDYVVAVKTTDRLGKASASYIHNINADLTVGGSYLYQIQNTQLDNVLALATSYSVDRNTAVKAKFSSEKLLTVALEQRLDNPRVKLGLATEYNVGNQSFTPEKFGISLSLGEF